MHPSRRRGHLLVIYAEMIGESKRVIKDREERGMRGSWCTFRRE